MSRVMATCFLICSSGLPLAAADWSAAEISAGPSLMRIVGQDLFGGQAGILVNRWQHVSLIATFGYYQANQETHLGRMHRPPGRCDDDNGHPSDHDRDRDNACPLPDPVLLTTGIGDVYTYMGGLRIRRKLIGRMAGFAQAQVGGARVGADNGMALAAGGGAQFSISQRFAAEARVEYLRVRMGGNHLDGGLQATVGIVLRFGPWWGGYRKP